MRWPCSALVPCSTHSAVGFHILACGKGGSEGTVGTATGLLDHRLCVPSSLESCAAVWGPGCAWQAGAGEGWLLLPGPLAAHNRLPFSAGRPPPARPCRELLRPSHALVCGTHPPLSPTLCPLLPACLLPPAPPAAWLSCRELLRPSASVALHRHSNALVDILPPEADSTISVMSQTERPDVSYQDIGGMDIQKQEIREAVELPLTQVRGAWKEGVLGVGGWVDAWVGMAVQKQEQGAIGADRGEGTKAGGVPG